MRPAGGEAAQPLGVHACPGRADFENFKTFKPAAQHEKTLNTLLDQVIAWGGALKPLRQG